MNEPRKYEYDAILHEDPDSGGAYVIFPWDLKKEFGKGRVKVHAEFDGIDEDAQHFYRKLGYKDCGGLTVDVPGYEQPMELFMVKQI